MEKTEFLIALVKENWTVFSAIGAVSLLFLSHVLSVSREGRVARREVGKRIADAFRPELDSLIQTANDARTIMTEESFKRHESTILNNLPGLAWHTRPRLHYAWEKLAHHPQAKHFPYYAQYSDYGSLNKRSQVRPMLIARIKRIISLVE